MAKEFILRCPVCNLPVVGYKEGARGPVCGKCRRCKKIRWFDIPTDNIKK